MKLSPFLISCLLLAMCGCRSPRARLSFPTSPIVSEGETEWFEVSHLGYHRFGLHHQADRIDAVVYDDCVAGEANRTYRFDDYANESVPHVILLLDSIPYETMRKRYDGGDFRWFDPPQKTIAPFPSLTDICYSDVLHAPPLPGVIDQYFDVSTGRRNNALWHRITGYAEPWERRCAYYATYSDQAMSFLDPRQWYAGELERAHRAINASPDQTTIVYIASAASMVCKYGERGAEEVLDGARQLCLQLMCEHHGAIKITMLADHGHNYCRTTNVSLESVLGRAGFHVGTVLNNDNDVILEINALVTCAGVRTHSPAKVALALTNDARVELAMYMDGDRVIVRNNNGEAAIESRGGRMRYQPIDADVLRLADISKTFIDADGFADDRTWFERTMNCEFPNAPRRIWDAFHRQVVNPPDVLLTMRDGYCAGLSSYANFIHMASTHGGLNQINSASFIMTMTGRITGPMRHQDILSVVAPGYEPRLVK